MNPASPLKAEFQRVQRIAAVVGVAGLLLAVVGLFIAGREQFFQSYLFGFLFWNGFMVGSIGIYLLHNVVGGNWGVVIRRFVEAGARTLPLNFILLLPILIFGIPSIYYWAQPAAQHDANIQFKAAYLNIPFFIARSVFYFAVWGFYVFRLTALSAQQDRTGDPAIFARMKRISPFGLLLFVLTVSFAFFDWIMSLEPHWSSTIFGWQVIAGQAVTGVSFLVVILALLAPRPPFDVLVRPKHFNDLASLLLTAVILWSYLTFVQLLVTWMGDKQDEVPWFTQRLNHGWFLLGCAIVLFHFFVPFFTLLMRSAKQKRTAMLTLCSGLLIVRAIDNFWMVSPSGDDRLPYLWHRFSWMDLVFPIGMGGLWLAAFLWRTAGEPLIAEGDVVALAEPQPA